MHDPSADDAGLGDRNAGIPPRYWIDRLAGSFLMVFGVAEIRRSL